MNIAHMEKKCCDSCLGEEEKENLINVSKALSSETRIEILEFLFTHPGCITGNIVDYLPLAQSTVSQHLKVLKESGIIVGQVEGPAVKYCVDKEVLKKYKNIIEKIGG